MDGDSSNTNATSVPAAPNGSNAATVAAGTFSAVRVRSLTVPGHHALLTQSDAWTETGTPIPEPPYQAPAPPGMVSRTTAAGSYLALQLVLDVSPPDAPQMACTIGATATWGDKFVVSVPLAGGSNTVTLESSVALAVAPQMLAGDLTVAVSNGQDTPFDDAVHGLQIALTLGTPASPPDREAGITTRHMAAAAARAAAAGSADPAAILKSLMAVCAHYTLQPSDKVPPEYGHPKYLIQGQGGALPIHLYSVYNAECQAICRFSLACAKLLGLPGSGEVRVIWADPNQGGATQDSPWASSGGLDGVTREGPGANGETQYAQLLDAYAAIGHPYRVDGSAGSIGCNNFEACLVWTFADGSKLYFPGGLAGASFDSAETVILCFSRLAWIAFDPTDASNTTILVREVVKEYRDASEHVIGGGG